MVNIFDLCYIPIIFSNKTRPTSKYKKKPAHRKEIRKSDPTLLLNPILKIVFSLGTQKSWQEINEKNTAWGNKKNKELESLLFEFQVVLYFGG